MRIELELNGAATALEADAGEPLLAVLRRAGLPSVRPTCGIGVCGACTVLVEGEPISSCLLLAPLAAGRRVTTLEGLGDERREPCFRPAGSLPVRVLYARHGADRARAPLPRARPIAGAHPRGAGRKRLPLRVLRPHRARRASGRGGRAC